MLLLVLASYYTPGVWFVNPPPRRSYGALKADDAHWASEKL
jgi:hypothetical protein